MSKAKFYIYSKNGCGYCHKLQEFLDSKNIPHETFTLGREFTTEQFLTKFGRGSSFPQVNYKNENLGGMRDTVKYIMKHNIL